MDILSTRPADRRTDRQAFLSTLTPSRGSERVTYVCSLLSQHALFSLSVSHSDTYCLISPACWRNTRATSNTLGLSFFRFHGGGSHHSVCSNPARRNCSRRIRLMATNSACVVRSIGCFVQARPSSPPHRCFKSRKPSSWRARAADNSTIGSPLSPSAELTSRKRFVNPSTSATTALTGRSEPSTRHRQTTSFQRTRRLRP